MRRRVHQAHQGDVVRLTLHPWEGRARRQRQAPRAYRADPGGVRVVIRGTCDRQEFAVFTSNVDAVADVIRTIEREEWQ